MQEPGPDADVRASGEVPLVGADLEREFRGASALAGTALRSSRSRRPPDCYIASHGSLFLQCIGS